MHSVCAHVVTFMRFNCIDIDGDAIYFTSPLSGRTREVGIATYISCTHSTHAKPEMGVIQLEIHDGEARRVLFCYLNTHKIALFVQSRIEIARCTLGRFECQLNG